MSQCKAIKVDGKRCRKNALPGSDYCNISSHGNYSKTYGEKLKNIVANSWLQAILIVIAVVGLPLAIYQILIYFQDKKENTHTGILTPEEIVFFSPLKKIYPQLEFGDSGTVISQDVNSESPLFSIAEENALTVKLTQGKVRVTTQIRDRTGTLVTEIVDNEWKVSPPPNTWDRNYNHNSLEVRDAKGDVVLQIKVLGNRMQLQGRFYNSRGYGMEIVKGFGDDGKIGGLMFFPNPQRPPRFKIYPMFKYPSSSHLGETVGYLRPADELPASTDVIADPIKTPRKI